MSFENPIIQIRNGYKTWHTGHTCIKVLNNINLDIFTGESLAIMGPSGSGKSTLMHVMGLLTPLDQGELTIDDKSIQDSAQFRHHEIRNYFGFIFQDGKLINNLTVLENVAVPLAHRGYWPAEQKKISMNALELVGLEDRINHLPNQLSGGEMIRVAIARAIVIKPKILFADEPTGNLDIKTGKIISEILFNLVNQKRSIVIITHHLPLAKQADRMIYLEDGEIKKIKSRRK